MRQPRRTKLTNTMALAVSELVMVATWLALVIEMRLGLRSEAVLASVGEIKLEEPAKRNDGSRSR